MHILTASFAHAQLILSAALQAGFRESGAVNLTSATGEGSTPMVAVRSMGLALESVIGRLAADGAAVCVVSNGYLQNLLEVCNDRFKENSRRTTRFRDALRASVVIHTSTGSKTYKDEGAWEDPILRRQRKKAEGLERSKELKQQMAADSRNEDSADDVLPSDW